MNTCTICKKKIQLYKSLWDEGYWNHKQAKINFDARLIPLNKVSPKIPKFYEYWPIVVTSPIWKVTEARVAFKLWMYMEEKLIKEQVGFVPRMETGVNILKLNKKIKAFKMDKEQKNFYLCFIDLKGAYDWCNWESIYKKLKEKNILDMNEIQMLKFLHENLNITLGNYKTTTKRGLIQGSMISPYLFNIYFEDILKK